MTMRKTGGWLGLALMVGLTAAVLGRGQTGSRLVNYQGRLTDAGGQPLDGVTVDLTFSFYGSAAGDTMYLSLTQDNVLVTAGVYQVLIGSGTISGGSETSLADVVRQYANVWMGVRVNGGPELTPRALITGVPYALAVDPAYIESYITTLDWDGDGYDKMLQGGADCNDADASIYPGAPEVYGDGIDQDCVGADAPLAFLINPHLQLGNQASSPGLTDRVTVAWATSVGKTAVVKYGTSFPLASEISDPVKIWHEVTLPGLAPDTLYFYQVIAGSSVAAPQSFRTAPTDLHAPFTFAAIGDTRTGDTAHQQLITMMTAWKPAFVLHGGDMVNTGTSSPEWRNFFNIEAPLLRSAPIAPVIGNHDVGFYASYCAVPTNLTSTEFYYSWTYGNVHFIHASSEHTGAAQDALIFADLAAAAAAYPEPRFIVVVFHRNAYANGGHPGDENYAYSTIWGPQFEDAQVAMVVQGHNHYYERFEPIDGRTGLGDPPGEPDQIRTGVTYVTSGGGGAPLYAVQAPPGSGGGGTPPLDSLAASSNYEAMKVEVEGGRMSVTVQRPSDQQILDQFTVIRNQAPVANAGTDFSGTAGLTQTLFGTASSDLESDPLTYQWTQTAGTAVAITNPGLATASFTPLVPDVYTFQLQVGDGIDTAADTVTVTVY